MGTKKNTFWLSNASKILLDKTGSNNPVAAILKLSRQLIRRSGIKEPPFKPKILGEMVGIKEIKESRIECDGYLIPFPSGYVIEVNSEHSIGRKNFSICHEIAHTFFFSDLTTNLNLKTYNCSVDLFREEKEEERLCNIAAAELLMPLKYFKLAALEYGPSPNSILKLADVFKSSIQSTIYRLIETSVWECIFVKWNKRDNDNRTEEGNFYVGWTKGAKCNNIFHRYSRLEEDSFLYSVYDTGSESNIRLRGLNLLMQSIKISDSSDPYILSVVTRTKG